MSRSVLMLILGVGVGIGLAQAGGNRVEAQPKPSVQTLLRTDLQGIPGREAILEVLTVPPGLATPRHMHPDGHEIVYVLEGSTTAEIDGRENLTYRAGEVVHVEPNVPHIGRNASATEPLKVLTIRIKAKNQPITVLVP